MKVFDAHNLLSEVRMGFFSNFSAAIFKTFVAVNTPTAPAPAPAPTPAPAPAPAAPAVSTPTPARPVTPTPTPTIPATSNGGPDGSPFVNVAALAYGRDPNYSASECQDMGKKFDVLLVAPGCQQTIKQQRPDSIILAYNNISNCTDGDQLCTYLQSLPNPESYFLHFGSSSVQDIDGRTYSRNSGDRVCSYTCDNRWTTNYLDPQTRNTLVDFFSDPSHLPAHTDGWFFDNMDRGCSYSGALNSGSVLGGISGNASLSSGPIMEAACNALLEQMDQNMPSDMYFITNTSNYGASYCDSWGWAFCTSTLNGVQLSRPLAQGMMYSRGVLQEFEYRITTRLNEFEGNYGGLKEIWNAKGSPHNNLYIMWWIRAGDDSGIPDNDERIKIFALSTHLLYQFERSYMRYDGQNQNNTPLTGDWYGAMGVNIGNANGDKTALDDRTFKRSFDNGIVLVRFRVGTNDNYSDSQTYDLGGNYYPVNSDGSLGSPVSSVNLKNSQGFIGIKNP
jgi:hypothetical protein